MKCPKCQADNPDTQSFCGDCGTKLDTAKEAPAFTKTLETPFPQLAKGTTLADRYEILGELGKGGMGEVYLAEDTNLKRQVAIKVLPQQFALDKERLARFEREARLLASLNHPNIASIHGLEKSDGQQFLVMELVEGETLRELISKGPLPLDEALETCKQIAEGLESAHEKGIIHRDLKPSNVKISPEGKVKILDFGIAKVFREQPDEADISKSRAATDEMTQPGMILGTAAYMSPEQAKGKAVDKRTDIWAFGCILFECLTGRRPFEGETTSETIASILKGEPVWSKLPPTTPSGLRSLIRRCLRKDKNRRLHDISDARIEMEDMLTAPEESDQLKTVVPGKLEWRYVVPWILGAVVITALITVLLTSNRRLSTPAPVMKVEIGVEPAKRIGGSTSTEQRVGYWRPSRTSIAISPDGNQIVFEGVDEKGWRLYRRDLGKEDADPIANTDGGRDPFFSPDGGQIGFHANGKLMRIPAEGGMAAPLFDCGRPFGVSWGPDDVIIHSNGTQLLLTAAGGEPEVLTELNRENNEIAHLLPHILPGGDSVLFSIRTASNKWYNLDLYVFSLKTGEWNKLLDDASDACFSPTRHIVFARQGELWAAPFSLDQLKVTGKAQLVIPNVMHASNGTNSGINTYAAQFSFSETGTLAFIPGDIYPFLNRFLVLVDKNGALRPLIEEAGVFWSNAPISPTDHRLAAYATWDENQEIWIYDREANTRRLLTDYPNRDSVYKPLWHPDGKRLVYCHSSPGQEEIYLLNADGSGEPEKLFESGDPSSWSPDGKLLAFVRSGDIWIYSMESGEAEAYISTPNPEDYPVFSPDGSFLAYSAYVAGSRQVYITPYPGPPIEYPVSNEGGSDPSWSLDGSQLYYLEISQAPRARMMVVDIQTSPSIKITNRRVLFDCWGLHMYTSSSHGYNIHPDGQSFITLAYYYGGKAVNYADIPQDIMDGLNVFDKQSLGWFKRWLKEDKDRVLSPTLEFMLQGQTVTKINIIQNWFEELKQLVPTGKR